MAGPFSAPPLDNFRTSPIGVVPKKNSLKFRMITVLSSPKGMAINDFISDDEASVSFNTFDSAAKIVASLGPGALMAKLDMKSAFRICPVRVSDWNLLGFSFSGYFFVDLCLPFGLRSSVNRFTQLASTLLWIMPTNYNITHCTHYLDDFFLVGPPSSQQCFLNMSKTIDLFSNLGIPLADDKQVGPTARITFLGIEIHSTDLSLRLPADKLHDLLFEISTWARKKNAQNASSYP